MDDAENPAEPEPLRRDVIFHLKEAERLEREIPDSIIVSMFLVDCAAIRKQLSAKHETIAKAEKDLIAKQAKAMANATMEAFQLINEKINSSPTDIEELSAIREFIGGVPNEIKKLEGDIKIGMQTYAILEEFQHKFPDDEDYDKQWKLYGSPNETYEVVRIQRDKLEKEEHKMVNKMQQEQSEFDNKVIELQQKANAFTSYADASQFEDYARQAVEVWSEL